MFWLNKHQSKRFSRHVCIFRRPLHTFSSPWCVEAHSWSFLHSLLIWILRLLWKITIIVHNKVHPWNCSFYRALKNVWKYEKQRWPRGHKDTFGMKAVRFKHLKYQEHGLFQPFSELCKESYKVSRNMNGRPILSRFLDLYLQNAIAPDHPLVAYADSIVEACFLKLEGIDLVTFLDKMLCFPIMELGRRSYGTFHYMKIKALNSISTSMAYYVLSLVSILLRRLRTDQKLQIFASISPFANVVAKH